MGTLTNEDIEFVKEIERELIPIQNSKLRKVNDIWG
jgi:hypothetical protein